MEGLQATLADRGQMIDLMVTEKLNKLQITSLEPISPER